MTWKIEWRNTALKHLRSLDKQVEKRILSYVNEKIVPNPRRYGKPLKGQKSGLWSYRMGDYRIIGHLKDDKFIVLLVAVGHRKEIYDI